MPWHRHCCFGGDVARSPEVSGYALNHTVIAYAPLSRAPHDAPPKQLRVVFVGTRHAVSEMN